MKARKTYYFIFYIKLFSDLTKRNKTRSEYVKFYFFLLQLGDSQSYFTDAMKAHKISKVVLTLNIKGSFNIKYSRTNQLKHSFSIFGARIWNSIPQSIRILPKYKFKVSLHQLFLRILELEDLMLIHLL